MNAIEITNLSKNYPRFRLNNVSLSLPQGSVMGLIGENGAGKTTLIRLILDIIKRDSGEVTVLGRSNKDNFHVTKQDIGVVLSDMGFSPRLSLIQLDKVMSITYREWDSGLYHQLLSRFRLAPGQRYGTLSDGLKMSLNYVIALSHRPRLLILDEPTNSLDPVARDEVIHLLFEFTRKEERSVLISSHIVTDLEKVCDNIAFLHEGSLLLCQDKESIFEQFGIVRCAAEEVSNIPSDCIVGREEDPYGVCLLVRRDERLAGVRTENVDLERLFVMLVRRGYHESPVSL